jgi:mRNA interferase MazF
LHKLQKGNIHLVDFNPVKTGEIGKLRPAIILSDNEDLTIFTTAIVIPLSTIIIKNNTPYRYFINKRDKLNQNSDACLYEIRALSKIRIKNKIAAISQNELTEIRQFLMQII